jgi:hypothetical protein
MTGKGTAFFDYTDFSNVQMCEYADVKMKKINVQICEYADVQMKKINVQMN